MNRTFTICKDWDTEKGRRILKNRELNKGDDMDRSVACLTYPSFQLILEACRGFGGDEPVYSSNEDNKILLSYFTCLKGKATDNCKILADEDGMIWESNEYADDMCEIDFTADGWEQRLEAEMIKVAERFVKDNPVEFDQPNF